MGRPCLRINISLLQTTRAPQKTNRAPTRARLTVWKLLRLQLEHSHTHTHIANWALLICALCSGRHTRCFCRIKFNPLNPMSTLYAKISVASLLCRNYLLIKRTIVVHAEAVRLCLWTATSNGSVVHPPVEIWESRATGEWYRQGKFLIRPPELSVNSTSRMKSYLVAKHEERGEGNSEFCLRKIYFMLIRFFSMP
jgi:hypothetical protein